MKHSVATFFHMDPNKITYQDIRQFGASITNLSFSTSQQTIKQSAPKDAAELCNHSAKVHDAHYSTHAINRTELIYSEYHQTLGEDIELPQTNISWTKVSSTNQERALKLLCGEASTFRSKEQQQMIDICCNDWEKHSFFAIACGGGKSLSVLVPVVAEFLSCRFTGCRFLLCPMLS